MILRRLKYSNKIRVLFVPIFLVFAVGLMFIYNKVAERLTVEHEERLSRTADLTLHNLDLTAREMRKLANLFRSNRTLTEYLYIVNVLGGSKSVLGDFLSPYFPILDIDFIRLYDERGNSVYNIDDRYPEEKVVHSLGERMPEETIYGFSETRDSVEIVSTAPLFGNEGEKGLRKIVGFISVGKYASHEYLSGLKEVSGNEILLIRDSKVLVSSLEKDEAFLPSEGKVLIGKQAYSFRGMPVKDLYGTTLISMTVAISDEPLVNSIKSLRTYMSLILLVAVVLFMGLSYFIEKILVTPLNEIIRFISGIAAGRFDGRLSISGQDEVSFLAKHLIEMQEQLKEGHALISQYAADLQNAVDQRTGELTEVQEKLLRAQRMEVIGQLTSGVAHEVRNPLNAIMALTDALDLDIGNNPELKPFLVHLRTQVFRLSSLMNELLDLGKPVDTSQFRSELLNDICLLAIDAWKQTRIGQQAEVTFRSFLPDKDCAVLADGGKFQQMLINLLDNAVQHSPEGSTIEIKAASDNEKVLLSVIDQGRGIPGEILPKVFESFFTTRKGGTGLGLGIVKNIVELHGGSIRVFNNDPPPGCSFEITLPVCKEEYV